MSLCAVLAIAAALSPDAGPGAGLTLAQANDRGPRPPAASPPPSRLGAPAPLGPSGGPPNVQMRPPLSIRPMGNPVGRSAAPVQLPPPRRVERDDEPSGIRPPSIRTAPIGGTR